MTKFWTEYVDNHPEALQIPKDYLTDPDKAKVVNRLKRNYVFDRARYWIPTACVTNMMLVMSARGWAQLVQNLLSHYVPEANELGKLLKSELDLAVPLLSKYARESASISLGLRDQFSDYVRMSQDPHLLKLSKFRLSNPKDKTSRCSLEVLPPATGRPSHDLQWHYTRYDWVGDSLKRTAVRFAWPEVSFAEIRDLNRHRTGSKYCPFVPQGFYGAAEQISEVNKSRYEKQMVEAYEVGIEAVSRSLTRLAARRLDYMYWLPIGATFYFEHTTTADKFIYEAELRTGLGSHFAYSKHLKDMLKLWYEQFPATEGLILEGTAEPEL